MIRCRTARRLADTAMESELSLEQRFRLEDHTTRCPACAGYEQRSRRLQEWLEGPGDPPPNEPDVDGAVRAVLSALERGEGRPWHPPVGRRRVAAAVGLFAVAAGILFLLRRPGGSEESEPVRFETVAPIQVAQYEEPEWNTASVEALVRASLLDCFGSGGVDRERAKRNFIEGTREPARSGWSVRRFVEGLLESPDANVGLAAARFLASTGEGSAAPVLERALGRPAIAEGVLDALGALGESAVPALERSLSKPSIAPRVLLQLCRIGGPRAAGVIERATKTASEKTVPSREALLDALTTTGPDAVASLLRLAADSQGEESAAILARLNLVDGAGPRLARILEEESLAGDLAYRALNSLRPYEALPWLEERCGSHRERGLALETLANYPGMGPLESILRLSNGGRGSREELLVLLVELLERDGERAEAFSRQLMALGQSTSLQSWLSLLIESGHPGAGSGLVPLAFCEALGADDRSWAALAVGEMGTVDDGDGLIRELVFQPGSDRRSTAACVLSIYRLLGAEAVEGLFDTCSAGNVRRILASLEGGGRSGEAVRVHRLARVLDGALTEMAGVSADKKKDIL